MTCQWRSSGSTCLTAGRRSAMLSTCLSGLPLTPFNFLRWISFSVAALGHRNDGTRNAMHPGAATRRALVPPGGRHRGWARCRMVMCWRPRRPERLPQAARTAAPGQVGAAPPAAERHAARMMPQTCIPIYQRRDWAGQCMRKSSSRQRVTRGFRRCGGQRTRRGAARRGMVVAGMAWDKEACW